LTGPLLAGAGASIIAIVQAPATVVVPSRDGGAYLYAASRLLAGEVLYRDVWDHKPPGIHVLTALGLLLGQGSAWGVWALALAALVVAAVMAHHCLRRLFGPVAAGAGSVLWLAGLTMLASGLHAPELFALPLSIAAIALAPALVDPADRWRPWLALGLLVVSAALLKPTLLGTPIAAGCVGLVMRWRTGAGWASLAGPLAAGAVVGAALAGVALVVATQGALPQAFDAIINYNLAYAAAGSAKRAEALVAGVRELAGTLLPVAALTGWIVLVAGGLRRLSSNPRSAIAWTAVVSFPVELWLVTATGRAYAQYFLSWLPAAAVLAAAAVYDLQARSAGMRPLPPAARRAITVGLTILPFLVPAAVAPGRLPSETPSIHAAVALLRAEPESRPVVVWGAESTVHSLANRVAPSRFVYHYPLFTAGYAAEAIVGEFDADMEQRRPRLLIDTSTTNRDVPPLDPSRRAAWRAETPGYAISPSLDAALDRLLTHYRPAGAVGQPGWPVYTLIDVTPPGE
jgi:hypothetical protein